MESIYPYPKPHEHVKEDAALEKLFGQTKADNKRPITFMVIVLILLIFGQCIIFCLVLPVAILDLFFFHAKYSLYGHRGTASASAAVSHI